MYVRDEKWAEIIAITREHITSWKGKAVKHGLRDKFASSERPDGDYQLIVTHHQSRSGDDWRMLAREKATGEIRKAKPRLVCVALQAALTLIDRPVRSKQ